MHLDARAVKLEILTFKEGLLSAAGHDLVLRAEGLSAEVTGAPPSSAVTVTVDPLAIRVLPTVHGLSAHDRAQIEKAMTHDVLDAKHHPSIVFRSTRVEVHDDRIAIEGELSLVGRTRPVALDLTLRGDEWQAELSLSQPDFGIRPYTAMLGALKVKPDVRLRVSVPRSTIAQLAPRS